MRWGKDDPAVLSEGIEAIARESENMQRIIEQLLLLARLGNFSLNATRFNLVEVVAEIAESYKMVDFTHAIVYRCHEDAITLETDKNLVTECVRALIDNAIKYTPEGGRITVSCEMREGRAEICVEDTGVGIKEEDLPHIFERFYRCDKARGREKGSTGLGLSIAKSIVNTVGGEISVESTVGVGTKFTVTV
ncbi:MAG: cell wall metabolism sensor histidine kinase WalK, partial [Clostridiales bacterium]|nr:cell wall metabolism sensor histidine kinase WalK [Clostridiales bacterium]